MIHNSPFKMSLVLGIQPLNWAHSAMKEMMAMIPCYTRSRKF